MGFFGLAGNSNKKTILNCVCQLTGSPLMYQDKLLEGLEICAIHMRSAVSPTWYCFLGVSIVGPSFGKSVMKSSFYG